MEGKGMKILRCNHCGNIATLIDDKGVPLVCCGEAMAVSYTHLFQLCTSSIIIRCPASCQMQKAGSCKKAIVPIQKTRVYTRADLKIPKDSFDLA